MFIASVNHYLAVGIFSQRAWCFKHEITSNVAGVTTEVPAQHCVGKITG